MYYPGYEVSYELWHLPYMGYVLWLVGLLNFTLLMSSDRPARIASELIKSKLGFIFAMWMLASVFMASTAWPLLFAGLFIPASLGAPPTTILILTLFAGFTSATGGKLVLDRWFPSYG